MDNQDKKLLQKEAPQKKILPQSSFMRSGFEKHRETQQVKQTKSIKNSGNMIILKYNRQNSFSF